MIIKSPWRRERLFVLLGDKRISVVWAKPDWLGRWCAYRVVHAPLEGEITASSLITALARVTSGWPLGRSFDIHWFLPPDILAVALVGKSTSNEGGALVLPYPQGEVVSAVMSEPAGANIWLWIHQAWIDLIHGATEELGGRVLYLHPRAIFLKQLLHPEGSLPATSVLHVIRDGNYAHIHIGDACVRSFSQDAGHAPQKGHQLNHREQFELTSASTVLGVPIASEPEVIQTDDIAAEGRLDFMLPIGGNLLHRVGILRQSLGSLAENRIRMWAVGLSVAVLIGVGSALYHQHSVELLNAEIRRELRDAVPIANAAQFAKKQLMEQEGFLTLAVELSQSVDRFRLFGQLVEKMPPGWTISGLEMVDDKVIMSIRLKDAKQLRPSLDIGGEQIKSLKLDSTAEGVSPAASSTHKYVATLPRGKS